MNNSIEIDITENGKNLYIFFGGIAAGIAMPPFEFYNMSKILNDHKIFIRDFSQNWYQGGLPSISQDVFSTAEHIMTMIKEIEPNKVYFVGNSMGGYAAILFSTLTGIGEVIAFAPQTFISPFLRLKHRDMRWMIQVLNTYRKSLFKQKVWDLKPLLLHSNEGRKISIFISTEDKLDHIHASHIENIEGVTVYKFDSGGHNIVRLLRDQGKLAEIMAGRYV